MARGGLEAHLDFFFIPMKHSVQSCAATWKWMGIAKTKKGGVCCIQNGADLFTLYMRYSKHPFSLNDMHSLQILALFGCLTSSIFETALHFLKG